MSDDQERRNRIAEAATAARAQAVAAEINQQAEHKRALQAIRNESELQAEAKRLGRTLNALNDSNSRNPRTTQVSTARQPQNSNTSKNQEPHRPNQPAPSVPPRVSSPAPTDNKGGVIGAATRQFFDEEKGGMRWDNIAGLAAGGIAGFFAANFMTGGFGGGWLSLIAGVLLTGAGAWAGSKVVEAITTPATPAPAPTPAAAPTPSPAAAPTIEQTQAPSRDAGVKVTPPLPTPQIAKPKTHSP